MGIIHSDKRISASQIPCDGTLKVTISLTAKPDIMENPADIVLVLDRSKHDWRSSGQHEGRCEYLH